VAATIKKKNGAATFDGADGVVLVKRMDDFLTNTTPSARMRSLRGIPTSRSHPSSAEAQLSKLRMRNSCKRILVRLTRSFVMPGVGVRVPLLS
jgi:hypothetical protein